MLSAGPLRAAVWLSIRQATHPHAASVVNRRYGSILLGQLLVIFFDRREVFRIFQLAGQLRRLVDQCRQALRANPGLIAGVAQVNQRNYRLRAITVQTLKEFSRLRQIVVLLKELDPCPYDSWLNCTCFIRLCCTHTAHGRGHSRRNGPGGTCARQRWDHSGPSVSRQP